MSNQAHVDVDATAEIVAEMQSLLGVAEESEGPAESPEAAETEVSEQPQMD